MNYDDFISEWKSPAVSIRCNTSGSTGTPKEIWLPKDVMRSSARRTVDFFGLTAASRIHSCISPDFIGGKMAFVRADVTGGDFSWETPSNRPFLNTPVGFSVDFVSIVPSQLKYILENSSLKNKAGIYLVGGAPVSRSLAETTEELDITAYESYGMTETASHIALRKIQSKELPFTLLPGIKAESCNGCLKIDVPGLPSLLTKDIVKFVSENEFFILGRADNVIISGAKKFYPEEIERNISKYIGAPFIITSEPDLKWGEKIVMVVEKNDDIDIDKLYGIFREILPPHSIPKKIYTTSELPRTESGKIKHIKLPSQLFETLTLAYEHLLPES